MRTWLPVLGIVLLGAALSTWWFTVIWGVDALDFRESSLPVRFVGTALTQFISVYTPFALPVSFGSLFGPAGVVFGFAYWPLIGFTLWRWVKVKSAWYLIGFAGIFLTSSFHWLYYINGLIGI